ncbi:MAG TPA: glycerol-3-phosphate dehydrogenase/oxidase [Candidatus Binatia bacterium]|nr:glycerol-3-phosphate dehydrogenase/oxidase [Candidatus Binatia bacterium]
MKRDLRKLSDRSFDVAVVGGGIYGVSIARDAALRGLAIALVEKEDFGGATSANSHKIVHGGLRYLQHADLRRMRESIHERSALLRIAPHLVRPQAFLMPTYGHGLRGREVLCVALGLNDLLSLGRNRALEPARHIPSGCVVSRSECLRLAPGILEEGLTGGALWHDGLMLNSERLLFAILRSAIDAGAEAANYAEATEILLHGGRAEGIRVRDAFSEERFEIRARVIVNAAGPWSLGGLGPPQPTSAIRLAKAMNLVTRPILGEHAIGVARRSREARGAVRSDRRLFFLVPWRDRTLIGTAYFPYDGAPDGFAITEPEIERFLEEVNWSYPPARLSRADVRLVHGGLVPVVGSRDADADVELATRYQIRDHAAEGLEGMITVTGVKYTTARGVAEAAVDRVSSKLGAETSRSRSAELPVWGGDIERVEEYVAREAEALRPGVTANTVRRLVTHYGSRHREVLAEVGGDEQRLKPIADGTEVTGAEVTFAVRREMAAKLADVVFRRTDLGAAGHPGDPALVAAAALVAQELGWDEARIESELAEVRRRFP